MNKKILYSILILLSFCFIDNVSAKSYTVNTDLYGDVVVDISSINEQYSYNQLEDYFIVANNGYALLTFSNDGSNQPRLCNLGYTGSAIRYACLLVTFTYNSDTHSWDYFSDSSTININNGNFVYMTFKYLNPISSKGWTVDKTKYYLLENGYLNLYEGEYTESLIPKISITKESENSIDINGTKYITDIIMNIEFSSIDNDKYYYLYKYGSDSQWNTIILENSNSISKTFTSNDTLYVQVLDKNTNETVSSATYTIDNINYDNTPYITFGLVDDEMCFANDVHICERLIIDSHITNFDQYRFYIFNHTLNQTLLGSTSKVNYYVYENSTIEIRIVDKYTNEVVADEFYTVSSISTDASLGHYISSTCNMNLENGKYECTYYIYNYDFEKYNYYYGTSTSIFKVIIPSKLSSSIDTSLSIPTDEDTHLYESPTLENVYILEKSYYEDTIAQFKIIDKETSEQVYYIEFNHDMAIKEDNSDINEIIHFVDKYILSKFPIVKQLGHIHECFTQFNFEDFYLVSPPSFTFDLSFINLEPVEVEMKVDDTIRFEVQTIIKAFATLSVVFVFVKEIGKILP